MDDAEFWAPRNCFLEHIPELDLAADLLSQAADDLLSGDVDLARTRINQADMPVLRSFTARAISSESRDVHRLRNVDLLPAAKTNEKLGPRQPSESTKAGIFLRDGYRCRYCSCRIVVPKAQSVLHKAIPGSVAWGGKDIELNAAFYTIKAVLDHVVPFAHGGESNEENLVTSCQPCNYGKGNYLLQQLGLNDPRERTPFIDEWDGLNRLTSAHHIRRPSASRTSAVEHPIKISRKAKPTARRSTVRPAEIDDWLAGVDDLVRNSVDQLLLILGDCAELGVSWKAKSVLAVHLTVKNTRLTLFGVLQDGEVQVPWEIGEHKLASRQFADILSAAIPGAESYETPKMWRVRREGRQLRVGEIVEAGPALRAAFAATREAIG